MNFDKRTFGKLPRNFFDLSYRHHTTGKIGYLYPLYREEVFSGDRIKLGMDAVLRFEPLVAPIMQSVWMNVEYFYVPFRIMDKGWEVFFDGGVSGEESSTVARDEDNVYWTNPPSNPDHTLWDYFAYPVDAVNMPRDNDDVKDYHITGFYRTAYNMIYNRYYRDENVINEVSLQNNDVLKRLWNKDYFTSALPFRQRGDEVSVPINNVGSGSYPINYSGQNYYFLNELFPGYYQSESHQFVSFNYSSLYGDTSALSPVGMYRREDNMLDMIFKAPFKNNSPVSSSMPPSSVNGAMGDDNPYGWKGYLGTVLGGISSNSSSGYTSDDPLSQVSPDRKPIRLSDLTSRLSANLGSLGDDLGLSIVDLRLSNQLQLFKELSARAGARYEEFLIGMFGVSPRSDVLQEPYYIGGFKRPVIISEVLQTSSTTEDSAQGNLAGRGLGAMSKRLRPFTVQEPGVIIGMFSLTVDKLYYNQGYGKELTRSNRFDYYFPLFSHLSEQPILRQEIYASFVEGFDNKAVFGYQEIYDEYRHRRDVATAGMQSYYSYWNFGKKYNNYPSLNKDFLEIDVSTSPFASPNTDHFELLAFNFGKAIRSLPKFGTPGSALRI